MLSGAIILVWASVHNHLLELSTAKFTGLQLSVIFTFRLAMTSRATSVSRKLHKRSHFMSCLGHDFSIRVQLILKWFAILQIVIQELQFMLSRPIDIGSCPEIWGPNGPSYHRFRITK